MADNKLTVEDLLSFPALQLTVKAGRGGLGRSVSWAHASELADPTPWLLGAEVIMTAGLAVPRSAAGQRAYLERLDDAGVSGLALSAQLHMPPLHDAFFRAAEERGFPVLEVPLAVPFIAVSQEVAASVQEDARHRLGAQLQVFGSLRWLVAEDLDTPTLLRRLERLSGYDVYLCTPQGRPLLPGVPAPEPGVLPASADAPPTIPGGFVLPVPAPGGPAGSWWRTSARAPSPRGSRSSSTSPRWRRCGSRWCATSARRCGARVRRRWPSCCRRCSTRSRPGAGWRGTRSRATPC
ncbi:PucR family transcriptional regulator ligand-binding domain-containing protein [Streptomyces sp. RKAG290]|uniref:PucR family transcriptional regulator ligand-binding domain-containing protein n=1 Tax=Streptomyces sp. RKAG290 TaxID=2888348 RepID=UPI002033F7FD|nr:PucR family transcriptional regulator ligand-binding domain-containing protein [Streptomyces sp. RKAG290]MCM2410542.1 PucR family transcriptional regulator ligand-binding domain-containing protein [Streptomyces sp. RKAG290]